MRKKRKITILIWIIILIVLSLPVFILPKFIGYITKVPPRQVRFYFYDESNCSLNGYVFSGEKLIGKTREGYFNLTYSNYKENFNTKANISLFGKLGSCFQEPEFLFDKYWESFEILDYYFDGESLFKFGTKINSHNPTKRELLGFIQPEKIKLELENVSIKREIVLEDLTEINSYLNKKINYVDDWDFNKEINYWQTPSETLEVRKGDCEEFSTTLISLFLAYNSSLNCYNVVFSSHVTTFCKINENYIYYDQQKTELRKQIENKDAETKTKLKELKEEYFKYYGINNSERAHYAFNDNTFREFSSEEEFIDWQYSLSEKQGYGLFEKMEKEALEVEEKYPAEEGEMELRTEKILKELPSLKNFFIDNLIIFILFLSILIVLIIILIKINHKTN